MGNGKGNPEYFVAEIQPGKIIYEMDGVRRCSGETGVCARCREAADPYGPRAPHAGIADEAE
jgi:hypothetical protein